MRILDNIKNVWKTQRRSKQTVILPSFSKAKIGGDDLDEKLVEVVSEENWQASTQQLHEIASAAYN